MFSLPKIVNHLVSLVYIFILKKKYKFIIGENCQIKGPIIVDADIGSNLILGDNVQLNSKNRGYHLNMHSPVKIMMDSDQASITIGSNTRIHGCCLHALSGIEIGSNCLIAANTQIMDCSGHGLSSDDPSNRINTKGQTKPVKISDNVWIGANCIVLPGVTIGNGSVVAAGSVVTKNIPPMTLFAGNPAKLVKKL